MKKFNFPFTAILGQDNMKKALILNVIDSKIGGVLLTGQQGTGKSTAVRSLVDVLPDIDVNEGCQFNCKINDTENLCEYCKLTNNHKIVQKPINLVNLPLGSTEEMVIGSLDIEKIIREGKRIIQPGLLAKAHQGILYVDEINLLQDHLVDILLDVSASGINVIEREGISLHHPASFILVGSMNPEEGELRPQISDRLGLEVQIQAPMNPQLRAQITQRVLEYSKNPEKFIALYQNEQNTLKAQLHNAKRILDTVSIPSNFYVLASEVVIRLGLYSQRADLTFLRCARAQAAFRGSLIVEKCDLEDALKLVFEHRIKRFREDADAEFLGETFDEIWHKIPEAREDSSIYQPTEQENAPNIFKHSPEVRDKYKENPLNKENADLPEVEDGKKEQKDQYTNFNSDDDFADGYKVGDDVKLRKVQKVDPLTLIPYQPTTPLSIDLQPIMDYIKRKRRITNYTGRGSRVRVLSRNSGHYIFARKPHGLPQNIAFDASIKQHYLNSPLGFSQFEDEIDDTPSNRRKLAVSLKLDDIKEKIFDLHAPLSMYFIVDASASMRRTLDQIIKIIQSVHAEGYKKKDKVSVLSFQGRRAEILQRPSVSLSVGLQKLRTLEATSYTPLGSSLHKCLTMINQESIKSTSIPVIVIMSDLGANISEKYPLLNASTPKDFMIIENELDQIAQEISKKGIKMIILKPKKSFATRYIGINPTSMFQIQASFIRASARIFEVDFYDPEATSVKLNQILK